jgi:hypothetical protein
MCQLKLLFLARLTFSTQEAENNEDEFKRPRWKRKKKQEFGYGGESFAGRSLRNVSNYLYLSLTLSLPNKFLLSHQCCI